MAIYSEFCEKRSVLFSTDVAARGLDFNKAVDWVVQVQFPCKLIVCVQFQFSFGHQDVSFKIWFTSVLCLSDICFPCFCNC